MKEICSFRKEIVLSAKLLSLEIGPFLHFPYLKLCELNYNFF